MLMYGNMRGLLRVLILIVITAMFTVGASSAIAADNGQCGDNITWELSDEGILTLVGSGEMHNFSSANENPFAKYRNQPTVRSIVVSEGITTIGANAFSGLQCESVTLPDSLEGIGQNAFRGAAIKSIALPNNVTIIGNYAFSGCNELEHISLPDRLESINRYAFSECSVLKTVDWPSKLKTIGAEAFINCKSLETGEFPNSITKIDFESFAGCGFNTIVLPSSLKSLGEEAFCGCSNLQIITFPDNLKKIGCASFANCKSLQTVTVPSGVKTVGEKAFYSCRALEAVNLSEGLTTIDNEAFYNCGLKTISIPASVTKIGPWIVGGYYTKDPFTGEFKEVKVTIKGYSGSIAHEYVLMAKAAGYSFESIGKYKPSTPTIIKLKGKNNGFNVTSTHSVAWVVYKNTRLYTQIQYSTGKTFKKSFKKTYSGVGKNWRVKDKRLKSKKKYYVRIREFKQIDGKRYYSNWSKAKTVTVK